MTISSNGEESGFTILLLVLMKSHTYIFIIITL